MCAKMMDDGRLRKLGKIGGKNNYSYYITLPMDYVKAAGWREGQKLVIQKSARRPRIIIEDQDR